MIGWIKKILYWHVHISEFNTLVRDVTKELNMMLMNLKIENHRNKKGSELNAVDPVIDTLEHNIRILNKGVNRLINEGREELAESTNNVALKLGMTEKEIKDYMAQVSSDIIEQSKDMR